jgi:DNA-binding response OmpR family regulator
MSISPRILVVDDDPQIRSLLEDVLELKNYNVITADDGSTAIDLLKKTKIDLVITDLQMSGVDGMKLLEHIHQEYPEVLVIMITAYGTIDITVEALKKGAYDFVSKPIQVHDFLDIVEKVVDKINHIKYDYLIHHYANVRLNFNIPAKYEFIGGISSHIQKSLDSMGYDRNLQSRTVIPYALEEALKNAIIHGCKENEVKKLKVSCDITDEKVIISVEDPGEGFNHSDLPDPTNIIDLDQKSGRGLLLIRVYMDEVFFSDNGNRITMVKYSKDKRKLN